MHIADEFVIPAGSSITIQDGADISFEPGASSLIVVLGNLLHTCNDCTVHYRDIAEIRVGEQGLLSYDGKMMVQELLDINVWDLGALSISGEDRNNPSTLQFHSGAELNSERPFSCSNAILEGIPLQPSGNEEWEGILASGPEARLDIEFTLIKDIHCDPVWSGTGVHLYQASNTENRIHYTQILRSNQPEKLGDALFLQPGSNRSYLELKCVDTHNDWWTGLTTVSSGCHATGLLSTLNNRGVGAHLTANLLYLDECQITHNMFEGLFQESGDSYNSTTLGENSMDQTGNNTIYDNGVTQIFMDGGILNGGSSGLNSENDIGHTLYSVPRVVVEGGATAYMRRNFWITATPDASMFIENNGTIQWDPYLSQSLIPDDLTCFSFKKHSRPGNLPPMARATLVEYALSGRMNEVYAFVNAALLAPMSNRPRIELLKTLSATEVSHVREFPDSIQMSIPRFTNCLRTQSAHLPGQGSVIAGVRVDTAVQNV